jgi:hypothetical protein
MDFLNFPSLKKQGLCLNKVKIFNINEQYIIFAG